MFKNFFTLNFSPTAPLLVSISTTHVGSLGSIPSFLACYSIFIAES